MRTTGDQPVAEDGLTKYEQMQAEPDFVALRARMRRFVFPLSVVFLLWYVGYLLLAAFAPGFMATPVLGNINIGLIIGLLQFVTTFAIATAYVMYANRNLDPEAERLRVEVER